ncbi:cyclic nucleotide-binding domain-containing protein [Aromatoleum toluvorans]|uniref:Cyclic nucleotide-binding domain-containing protein n=1 Tax=Aromatoleum toluvorans TaxID=92002 RepID=A0ABX1Q5L8_9RHOO|nr:Crp/Fnr family transcriptional regulator [Aromatoleum toluvorans]NMG45815.1 cyclic nucleotide-binding domain-containing protein [Aromatoleum toluvorans]
MSNRPVDIPATLRQVSFFSELSAEEIDRVARFTRERHLEKGEILFQRGDPVHGFYYVVSGQMKLAVSSAQGNEKVVEIISPMHSFGEAVMFLNRPYPVFAEALTSTQLLHIGQAVVSDLIDQDPGFARKLLAGMAIRLHGMIQDVETYSLRSSMQRVIGYLLQQVDSESEGTRDIALPTSKQVIASRLNLTPETLSRIFHDLTEAGLITVHGKHISLLDPARLARHQG